jgi:Lrp/AsnC family transcriptional regulator, leucine-responsive regulatory protein
MARRSPMSALTGAVERPQDRVPLDDVDLRLLRELSRDSRQSQRALARAIGMSAPAVAERIARFERSGVIRSYSVDIDWDRLGYDVVVYMPITLESGNDLEPTLAAFRLIPELEELTVVAGQYDLLARFRLSDHRRLRELLLDRVWQIPNVLRFETVLALGSLTTPQFAERMLGAAIEHDPAAQAEAEPHEANGA